MVNKIAIDLVAQEEGFRERGYLCSQNVITIGHGITQLTEDESLMVMGMKLTKLADKLRDKYEWFHRLNETRQAVITSMAYQLGMAGLGKFKRMIAALEHNDWEEAAKESLDSQYGKQTPNRARRQAEMLRKG